MGESEAPSGPLAQASAWPGLCSRVRVRGSRWLDKGAAGWAALSHPGKAWSPDPALSLLRSRSDCRKN